MTGRTTDGDQMDNEPKVLVLGDSVIAGLGARGRSYGLTVGRFAGCSEVLSLARSTNTIRNVTDQLDQFRQYAPDLIILGAGGADGLVHTSATLQRIVDRIAPKSWQGVEGLEPRTYYSESTAKRVRQKITSRVKVAIKHVGLKFGDGYQRTPLPEFTTILRSLFAELDKIGVPVIVCGIVESDPKFFPKTPPAMDPYRDALERESAPYAQFTYVDIRNVIIQWSDYLADHTHLTPEAHDKVAAYVIKSAAGVLESVSG